MKRGQSEFNSTRRGGRVVVLSFDGIKMRIVGNDVCRKVPQVRPVIRLDGESNDSPNLIKIMITVTLCTTFIF